MVKTAPAAHDEPRVTMLYLGVKQSNQNPQNLFSQWVDLGDLDITKVVSYQEWVRTLPEDDGNRLVAYEAGAKNISKASIGQVWNFIKTDTGVKVGNSVKYIGLWPNEQDIKEWIANEVVVKATVADLKRPLKDKTTFAKCLDSLSPICRAYARANTAGRAALLQKVITHIMRGR